MADVTGLHAVAFIEPYRTLVFRCDMQRPSTWKPLTDLIQRDLTKAPSLMIRVNMQLVEPLRVWMHHVEGTHNAVLVLDPDLV